MDAPYSARNSVLLPKLDYPLHFLVAMVKRSCSPAAPLALAQEASKHRHGLRSAQHAVGLSYEYAGDMTGYSSQKHNIPAVVETNILS